MRFRCNVTVVVHVYHRIAVFKVTQKICAYGISTIVLVENTHISFVILLVRKTVSHFNSLCKENRFQFFYFLFLLTLYFFLNIKKCKIYRPYDREPFFYVPDGEIFSHFTCVTKWVFNINFPLSYFRAIKLLFGHWNNV